MTEEIQKFKACELTVEIHPTRTSMGEAAAEHVGKQIRKVASEKGEVRIVFAAAVSQLEFIASLVAQEDIPWDKIIAFHMDEYHTLPAEASQRFGNFLKTHLFSKRNFGQVHYIADNMESYVSLLEEAPIDIIALGIGENGHLAFNDPPVADFNDPKTIKEVKLDEVCRQQQVNDGEFESIELVPETALTITMPAIMKADFLSVVVPGPTKAEAVKKTIYDEISTDCPSTILRIHPNAKLFLDTESSQLSMNKQ